MLIGLGKFHFSVEIKSLRRFCCLQQRVFFQLYMTEYTVIRGVFHNVNFHLTAVTSRNVMRLRGEHMTVVRRPCCNVREAVVVVFARRTVSFDC